MYVEFLSLKVDFVVANRADPDKMSRYAAFLSGSSLFAKVPVLRFPVLKETRSVTMNIFRKKKSF